MQLAIDVDREAMAQVVFNLLHNAVKYTGPDKQIRLRARRCGEKAVAIEVEHGNHVFLGSADFAHDCGPARGGAERDLNWPFRALPYPGAFQGLDLFKGRFGL